MAFVPSSGALVRVKSFAGVAVDRKPTRSVASVRMAADGGKESPVFGKAGQSQWKENPFTGGFPGGEANLMEWIGEGMKEDIPDMPKSMQPSSEFNPKVEERKGVLAMLDKTEFFKKFQGVGKSEDSSDEAPAPSPGAAAPVAAVVKPVEDVAPGDILSTEVPDESLYDMYFPKDRRNLAPDIKIRYDKNALSDRVGMAMMEVKASFSDLHYPKETKNKAPIIDIFYPGSLATASLSVKLDYVDGLPTLPPPPKQGEAVTTLVPGAGGGLKLNYEVVGTGAIEL